MSLVVRTTVAPQSVAKAMQQALSQIDRNVPVSNIVSMEQVVSDTLWQPRFNLQLIGLFAGLALLLAAVGLYGLMSYSVAQHTQEVGLRMALGARRQDVVRLIVRQRMKLTVKGVALGLAVALALTRLWQSCCLP